MKCNEIISEDFDQYKPHDLLSPTPTALSAGVTQVSDMEHLAQIIKQNCSTMLAAYLAVGRPIYRGIRGSSRDVIATQIRPNRKPVQMNPEYHKALAQAFTKLGLKANRTNSIFCTADKRTASDWGDPYLVFLKDGWEGTVFDGVAYDDYAFYKLQDIARGYAADKNLLQMTDRIAELKPRAIKTTADLIGVIERGTKDIIFTGTSYIGVHGYSKDVATLLTILKSSK